MGTNNLPDVAGTTIELDHVNDLRTAIRTSLVGRNAAGAPTAGQDLGTLAIPWGTLYSNFINIGGSIIDFDNIGASNAANSVISGATRSGSNQPDFIRATGSGAVATLLATTTPLVYTANSVSATVSADVSLTGLTVAPSSNNTCLVDDTSYAGGDSTKYEGEGTGTITIDTAGTEITGRVGQYVALKGTTEIMLAYVESATTLRNCFRGFFFDSSGAPIVREALTDNDTLTIMSLGWVFGQSNGTTFDVSYRSPYIQHTEPASPATDDYWFDQTNKVWKRYDGANFIEINRTLLGMVVIDGTNCIASRSIDSSKSYSDFIDLEVTLESTTVVRSAKSHSSISVYGQTKEWLGAPVTWDITADLESGLTEATSTLYYLYITTEGETIISDERPYNRRADLKGFYHPYHTWRFVGVCYNDGSSDLTSANSKNNDQPRVDIFTASGEYLPLPNIDSVKITVVGSGGGNGGGSNGAASSFGSIMTANGGTKGATKSSVSYIAGGTTNLEFNHSVEGGAGGVGSGGDININGQKGGLTIAGGSSFVTAGNGGVSLLAGIGSGAQGSSVNSGGTATIYGSGGGGGAAIKWISNLSSRIAVTVGTTNNDGICIVEY